MLFNSVQFLIFFPIVLAGYYLIPQRYRYIWLLLMSCVFYMQWKPVYILLLAGVTTISFFGGLCIGRISANRYRRIALIICIVIELGILAYFKYTVFIVGYLSKMIQAVGGHGFSTDISIVLPVGISFYTLQSIGYLIDVYRNDIYAERNFLRYALFISFFPQLVAGPIERSKNLLVQLASPVKFSFNNIQNGFLIMLYGFFLKVVIADRATIFVNNVYGNLNVYNGMYIILATIFFALQIYCDFYGYSTIAKGAALMLGIRLMDNFNAPYFSKSIKEFWRRWHISLSTWFRDYLYIPLGGNKKGRIRKYINIIIIFSVSGLWHGASLAFMVWGLLHGIFQILEGVFKAVHNKLKPYIGNETTLKQTSFSSRLAKLFITFSMACFAWIFFRAGSLKEALAILKSIFAQQHPFILVDGSIYEAGLSREYMIILILSVLFLFIVDYQKYRGRDVVSLFMKQQFWFRSAVIVILIFSVIIYGCYGEAYDVQQFIYFQF